METDDASISKIDWDFISDTIKNEKCILFLGPELFKNEHNASLDEQLAASLNLPINNDIQSYYEEDGLFLFTSKMKKTTSYYKIKNFYLQEFPNARVLLNKLAKIPFHLIVSITPDHTCTEVFKENGINPRSLFYWKKQKAEDLDIPPTMNQPVIYNMLGSIEKQESMVLTHDDLFDYFESIFQENSMPLLLKKELSEAHNYIFLGLDFDKWYMQLLLRILYLHNDTYEFMRYAANQKISDRMQAVCIQQFKIEFVPFQITSFVDKLVEHCTKNGVVRSGDTKTLSITERLKVWLDKDQIKEVLNELKIVLEEMEDDGTDLLDDVLLLSNRHRRLSRKINQGVIDANNADVEENKIRQALLQIINELKDIE